jgi:hypothetical protein
MAGVAIIGVVAPMRARSAITARPEPALRLASEPVSQSPFSSTLDALVALAEEARERGWDGYGAEAIKLSALSEAERFVARLPGYVEAPDVSGEPDGSVALEWSADGVPQLSVSFAGTSSIDYAGVFSDGCSQRGVERFVDQIPRSLASVLEDRFVRAWPGRACGTRGPVRAREQ